MNRVLKALRQRTPISPSRRELTTSRLLLHGPPQPQLPRCYSTRRPSRDTDSITLLSRYFSPTLKASNHESADALSLLQRGGYIRPTASGLFTLLPSGVRLQRNLTRIVARHMRALGASQVQMPTLLPAADWVRSGRWEGMGSELYRIKDRAGKEMLLAPTHEEEVTRLVGELVLSAKHLPVRIFQITRKHRDEPRARGGLIRTKEFLMKDMYTFDADEEAAASTYEHARWAYAAALDEILGVGTWRAAEADTGAMGGKRSHEYHVEDASGEDTIMSCSSCSYAANQELASSLPAKEGQPLSKASYRVHLFGTASEPATWGGDATRSDPDAQLLAAGGVKAAAELHGSKTHGATLRAVILPASRTLNEVKAAAALGVPSLRELTSGRERWDYAARPEGPLGSYSKLDVVVDDECRESLEYGAMLELVSDAATRYGSASSEASISPEESRKGLERLFPDSSGTLNDEASHALPTSWSNADVRNAADGDVCASCGAGQLRSTRAIEVGHTFILGTRYAAALDVGFTGAGKEGKQPFHMGCYGIGITRLMGVLAARAAASAEACGKTGFSWPPHLAPFKALVLPANTKEETLSAAQEVANALGANGALPDALGHAAIAADETLGSMLGPFEEGDIALDDRASMRMGEKLAEADLMGYPLVFVLGKHWEKTGEVEIKIRLPGTEESTLFIPLRTLTDAQA